MKITPKISDYDDDADFVKSQISEMQFNNKYHSV